MPKRKSPGSPGQVLIGAIVLLLIAAILVPVMVSYVQNEARWTEKQQKTSAAFHLAEAATERGYWRVSLSTNPTMDIPISGYNLDLAYADIPGGAYAVGIGSDSARDIIITGLGRDAQKKEIRAIQIVYAASGTFNNSVYNFGGNELEFESGATAVEWGPIYSQADITGTAKTYPRLYSPQTITGYVGSCPASPCTDSIHYWGCSCAPYLPAPAIDFNYYKQQAQSAGAAPPGCNTSSYGGNDPAYYRANNDGYFKNCQDTSGHVYYLASGNAHFSSAGQKNFIVGDLIIPVSGMEIDGAVGSGSYSAAVPPSAWKEYGLNATTWSHYQTFDPAAPSYSSLWPTPGLNGTYQSTASYNLNDVMLHGLLYAGGSVEISGGANNVIHGALILAGAEFGGGFTLYYDNAAAGRIHLSSKPTYNRTSWKELPGQGWPSGLP